MLCGECCLNLSITDFSEYRYLSWDDYFMSIAFLSAERSKDPNRQVIFHSAKCFFFFFFKFWFTWVGLKAYPFTGAVIIVGGSLLGESRWYNSWCVHSLLLPIPFLL